MSKISNYFVAGLFLMGLGTMSFATHHCYKHHHCKHYKHSQAKKTDGLVGTTVKGVETLTTDTVKETGKVVDSIL